jgi:indolepyruvate ferredoxin oxidoreductase
VAGVGGTGVITIGQLLGVAAHLDGRGIVTQDAGGLAQKGGATWSHVMIGASQSDIRTTRVSLAAADLVIGCDPIVTVAKETMLRMREGRTRVALNAHATPTAAFVKNGNWQNPSEACVGQVAQAVGTEALGAFSADQAATALLGDSIYTNPMMLGFAWQKGWIPLTQVALLRAIELNAVAVDNNKAAFEWGRRAAHDPQAFDRLLNPGQVVTLVKRSPLDELITRRAAFLTDYQDAAYAERYQAVVERVRRVDQTEGEARLALTEAVARYLFKVMAYKDEYEVARLHTDAAFHARIAGLFEGDYKLNYHLAPPLLAKQNEKGELQKRRFGPGMLVAFRLLARLKGLRGGPLDLFGRSEERRQERALISDYLASIDELLAGLVADGAPEWRTQRYRLALDIARVPEQIKGFGHVKARNLRAARLAWDGLLAQFRNPPLAQQVA